MVDSDEVFSSLLVLAREFIKRGLYLNLKINQFKKNKILLSKKTVQVVVELPAGTVLHAIMDNKLSFLIGCN